MSRDRRRVRRSAQPGPEGRRGEKRMDPTARTLLLGDLVFLAVCQMLYQRGMLSEAVNMGSTAVGAVLLAAALYFQFWRRGRRL
ncbi:MAG: hypothetical protein HFF53_07630 [Lawsonibacter sp.]|nr:hypothetical protein [Lawsonibacter sp.]